MNPGPQKQENQRRASHRPRSSGYGFCFGEFFPLEFRIGMLFWGILPPGVQGRNVGLGNSSPWSSG